MTFPKFYDLFAVKTDSFTLSTYLANGFMVFYFIVWLLNMASLIMIFTLYLYLWNQLISISRNISERRFFLLTRGTHIIFNEFVGNAEPTKVYLAIRTGFYVFGHVWAQVTRKTLWKNPNLIPICYSILVIKQAILKMRFTISLIFTFTVVHIVFSSLDLFWTE